MPPFQRDHVPKNPTLYGLGERFALAAGALTLLGIVVASALIAARTERDLRDAAHAQISHAITVDLLQAVVSSETGQRGYLLTERADYLNSYEESSHRVPGLLNQIEEALPAEQDLPSWRVAIQDKMAELAETIRLERSGQRTQALALVQTDRGKNDMDTARAIFKTLAAREQRTITIDLNHSRAGTQLLVAIDAGAFALLIILALFISRSLSHTVRALRHSQDALQSAKQKLEGSHELLEAAVAERTSELIDANEEIQRFAYIVSHDLRAPLLNIIGFTGELEDATNRMNRFVADNLQAAGVDIPEDVRAASRDDLPEAIRFIQTSTAKMDRLITAILRLSREGRRMLAPERLDMAAVLGGIVDSVRHQADEAGAEIIIGSVPAIRSDRLAVEQVFSNLIENALKYGALGRAPRIELSGRREGAFVQFEVRDNGRGVAERDLDRIFELFRRAGPQNTSGEGIGLAHVRALLRRMGGSISCESVPDIGSTFIVRLPFALVHSGVPTG